MLELGNVVPRDRHHARGDTKALRLSRLSSPVIQIMSGEGGTTPVGGEVLSRSGTIGGASSEIA
jgi:hypothetical protein